MCCAVSLIPCMGYGPVAPSERERLPDRPCDEPLGLVDRRGDGDAPGQVYGNREWNGVTGYLPLLTAHHHVYRFVFPGDGAERDYSVHGALREGHYRAQSKD